MDRDLTEFRINYDSRILMRLCYLSIHSRVFYVYTGQALILFKSSQELAWDRSDFSWVKSTHLIDNEFVKEVVRKEKECMIVEDDDEQESSEKSLKKKDIREDKFIDNFFMT